MVIPIQFQWQGQFHKRTPSLQGSLTSWQPATIYYIFRFITYILLYIKKEHRELYIEAEDSVTGTRMKLKRWR